MKEDEMDGAYSMQSVRRNAYTILFGKHQSSIRMIKSWNVKGVGHVARIADKSACRVSIGKPEEREQ